MIRFDGVKGRIYGVWTLLAVLGTLTAVVAGLSLGGITTGADQSAGQQVTLIDSCTTIDESGTYRLTDSIENSSAAVCIDVRASDVHFDGGGHVIDGNITRMGSLTAYQGPPPGRGIGVGVNFNSPAPLSNVTIANVTVTDWNGGVFAGGVSGVAIRNVTSVANGLGVSLSSSPRATVVDTTASDNGPLGVLLVDAPGSTVRNVTANDNIHTGVELDNSSDSTVRAVTATGNGFRGLGLEDVPIGTVMENLTVVDNDFSRNGYAGMVVFLVTDSTFSNNSVVGTRGTLPTGSSPPVPSAGVIVDGGFGNVFVDTDARNQAAWAYVGWNGGTNAIESLQTDAATVSFEGRDIALGPTATVPPEQHNDADTMPPGGDVTVTDMSPRAFIDLRITWSSADGANQPPNERATDKESP